MTPNILFYKKLSVDFDAAATDNKKKFLETVNGHLEKEYGVQPTKKGKRAIEGIFEVAVPFKKEMIILDSPVIQKLVEQYSRPIKALN